MTTTTLDIPALDTHAEKRNARIGFAYALAAFIWWGFAPLYFKAVASVPSTIVLGHRIVWSVLLLAVLIALRKQWPQAREAVRNPKARLPLMVSTILIAVNWLIFIYAIAQERLIEASLGYFINPLFTVVMGMVFFRERLRPAQWVAATFVAIGIIYLTASRGGLPWIAISLPATFAVYSVLRKKVHVGPMVGLFVETTLLFPIALAFLVYSHFQPGASDYTTPGMLALLSLAGAVTSLPLLWFVAGSKRLRFVTIGFMQYISPTLQFLTAVFLFGEAFDHHRGIAFAFIWTAVLIYVLDMVRKARASSLVNGHAT